jgi:hypothetical protein
MIIISNLNIMSNLITSKDSDGLEKFLSYCDQREQILKDYIEQYGSVELQNISKEFRAKVLQQKIEIICE